MRDRRAGPPARHRRRFAANWWSEDRRDSWLLTQNFGTSRFFGRPGSIDDADVGRDDPPPLGKPHPGLHLPPHPVAAPRVAIEQRRGDRRVAAIGGDDRLV